MKNLKYIILLVVFIALTLFLILRKPVSAPIVETTQTGTAKELCFAKFTPVNESGYGDKYTLRLVMDGTSATGELKLLPAEKDSKVGKFSGTVGAVDKMMMARTVNAIWDTLAEGMNTKEELNIIFGEGTADVGFGEMVDRGDGTYVYKDSKNISYQLGLSDVDCSELTIRENVELYLRSNIATLSPVKAVLGGKWYVTSVSIDVAKKSGTVMYEDGHIQEKKNFSFTTDEKVSVTSLTIN
ncbi:MAG: hypothetical protein KBC06_02865 [Candidatus Pacebacteria bacterium]|nr:hypothetical protein [Candidatus Paceibacterota bacterium]